MAALLLLASLVLVSVPLAPFARAQTVVATVPVGLGSCALAYDSLRGEVFVTRGGNAVSVISDATNTVIANVSVSGPWALAYDSSKGEVFVANDNRTVFVISDANDMVVATVKVGIAPVALTYDSLRSEVFVGSTGNTVYVISDATRTNVAGTVGISVGNSAVYSYVIFTTYASPSGNISSSIVNQMTVTVDSVNTTGPVGVVGYTLTLTEFNGTILNPPAISSNYTSIFDPYNNLTYFSQSWIGWCPFTYTDLKVGSANLDVNVTVALTQNETTSFIVPVDSTIGRSPGLIDVNITEPSSGQLIVMKFNSTTGWLESQVTYGPGPALGVERILTFQLLSLETSTATSSSTTTTTTTVTRPVTTTVTTTQTATSTTTRSSSSVPTWAYAAMAVLLIVGLAVGYIVRRPSASTP